ncbi:hypothetical protein KSF78_0004375 [Schistosoma japonicum]|nr:hypothetical protein KSF78_0004375 [Schistosoma japonicum]
MNDSDYETYQICICPIHIIQILSEYFLIYKDKIKNSVKHITNNEQAVQSIDTELHKRLHILWLGYFYELYIQPDALYNIIWIFSPFNDSQGIIRNFIWSKKISVKFRFQCSYCNHIWTSKKGCIHVYIGYRPFDTKINQSGYIMNTYEFLFSLDQQKCTQCNSNKLVLTYIRSYMYIRPINYHKLQYGYKIEFLKNSPLIFPPYHTKDKQIKNFKNIQISPNNKNEEEKKLKEVTSIELNNTLLHKSIDNSKSCTLDKMHINCNLKNDSHVLNTTEITSTTISNIDQVAIATTNLNQIDTPNHLNNEKLNSDSMHSDKKSTKLSDLKQFENDFSKKPSMRISRYI